jgi:hypothetical protein
MRYADGLLADGESVVLRSRQHWFALVIDGRRDWGIALGGLILLVIGLFIGSNNAQGAAGTLAQVIAIVAFVLLVVGLALSGIHVWRWLQQDYLVTTRRVLLVEGILNKRSMDSSLEKINDAVLDQSWVGRIFNYGDLDILTASEAAIDKFRMLRAAPEFKRVMLDAKHSLEMDLSYRPAPPLRAATAQQPVQQVPPPQAQPYPDQQQYPYQPYAGQADPRQAGYPAQPPAQTPPPHAPVPQQDSAGVTQTLARLADLRDRGAITPEEYEAKKAELLSRL